MYTVTQAAEESGRCRATITAAIRDGKLVARKDDHGFWQFTDAAWKRFLRAPRNPAGWSDEARAAALKARRAQRESEVRD